MSGCSRFKQNAWKKELCSNCYRPKEEHKLKKPQQEITITIPLKAATQGILSLGNKNKKKKKCVRFMKEESEVIGYGGVEASDSEDDEFEFERSEQPLPFEREVIGEQEKALEQLTKTNTDFNSVLKNLTTTQEPPKTLPPAEQPEAKSKKSSQAKPQQCSSLSIAASRKSHLTKLLEDENAEPAPAKYLNGELQPPETEKKEPVQNAFNSDILVNHIETPTKPPHTPTKPPETSPKPAEVLTKPSEVPITTETKEKSPEPKVSEEKKNDPGIDSTKQAKKEERGAPEGRKSLIQRGSIVTKVHEQVKNKLYVQKMDKRSSLEGDSDKENVKIIITNLSNEEKIEVFEKDPIDKKDLQPLEAQPELEKVTVKVMKLLNGEDGPPESREMAGEPDGKADSDEHEQEIAIVPPPRSSFLHRDIVSTPELKTTKPSPAYPLVKEHSNSTFQSSTAAKTLPSKPGVELTITDVKNPPASPKLMPSYAKSVEVNSTAIETPPDIKPPLPPVLAEGNQTTSSVNSVEVKIPKPTSLFSNLSPEFKSFKASLTVSPIEVKIHKGVAPTLPPTPLTLAKSNLPSTPSPTTTTSSPSSNSSLSPPKSASSSPKMKSASPPDCSSLSSYSSLERNPPSATVLPPLPTTPPPQPSRFPPPFFPNCQTSASLPILSPLQINTHSSHSFNTPSDDIPVLQEVGIRKRPAPKPPVDSTPEPFPRRRNSLEVIPASQEKKKTRVRQTLRKLLRFGSKEGESPKVEDEPPVVPRPRPQIIHPLDLNKSGVQVLPAHSMERSSSIDSSTSSPAPIYSNTNRPTKPPPPPRSESLNLMERLRPLEQNSGNCDNVYANLGEGRCGITPVKPQRTGSMREAPTLSTPSHHHDSASKTMSYQTDSEHVYECVGVSAGQDDNPSNRLSTHLTRGALSNGADDSEIYYPYVTFLNGECKTLLKKRGTITKTLEENYGALVVANLEALAHLLNKMLDKKSNIPPEIESLNDVRWSSFDVTDGNARTVVDSIQTVDAKVGQTEVTLLVSEDRQVLPEDLETFAQFSDSVPSAYCSGEENKPKDKLSIVAMKRCKVDKFTSYAQTLEKSVDSVREGVLLLLQIVKLMLQLEMRTVCIENFVIFSFEQPLNKVASYLQRTSNEEETSCQDAARSFCQYLLGDLPLGKILSKCALKEMPNVLEVWLWGPASLLTRSAIDRWLDLERANLLQSLVKDHPFGTTELHRLSFLVHTTGAAVASANNIIHCQVQDVS